MTARIAAIAAFAAAALVVSAAAPAQDKAAPFARYPAGPAYKGKTAPVDLRSHKDARMLRTRLREAARQRPNFAGHMIVTTWGCGTSCQVVALIDARTGKVTFGPTASVGVAHRLSSRLLVVNPPDTESGAGSRFPGMETEYYVWTAGKLVRIKR